MARRTEYDETQAAQRLKVPVTAFRWARHAGIVPAPDLPPGQWSRTAIEALDAGAVRAAMSQEPISGGAATDRIAAALGTSNTHAQKAAVTSFVVRRLITRGLLVDLPGNPTDTLHHPGRSPRSARGRTRPSSSPRTPRSAPSRPLPALG